MGFTSKPVRTGSIPPVRVCALLLIRLGLGIWVHPSLPRLSWALSPVWVESSRERVVLLYKSTVDLRSPEPYILSTP